MVVVKVDVVIVNDKWKRLKEETSSSRSTQRPRNAHAKCFVPEARLGGQSPFKGRMARCRRRQIMLGRGFEGIEQGGEDLELGERSISGQ